MIYLPFTGRERELDFLVREMSRIGSYSNTPRLLNISGERGVGKAALIEATLESLGERQVSFLVFRPGRRFRNSDILNFVASLAETGSSSNSDDRSKIPLVAGSIQNFLSKGTEASLWKEDPDPERESNNTTPSGLSLLKSNASSAHGGDSASFIAQCFINSLFDIFYQTSFERRSRINPQARKIFLIFDDYDSYSEEVRKWLGRDLLPKFLQVSSYFDFQFLITTSKELSQTTDYRFWQLTSAQVKQIHLTRLDQEETSDILQRAGLPSSLVEEGYQKSQGLPARIFEFLEEQINNQSLDNSQHRDVARLLSDLGERERHWIYAACMFPHPSVESIAMLRGWKDGKEGFRWLSDQELVPIRSQSYTDRLYVNRAFAQEVRRYINRDNPELANQIERKVTVLDRIRELAPSLEMRQSLAKLAPLQFFNRNLIDLIFLEDREAIFRFIQNFPKFFQHTKYNLTFSDELKPVLRSYGQAIYPELFQQISKDALALWETHHTDLMKSANTIESQIREEETSRKSLIAQIGDIHEQVYRQKKQLEPKPEIPPEVVEPVTPSSHTGWFIAGIASVVAAIVCFYVAILFAVDNRVAFFVMAFALLSMALLFHKKSRTHREKPKPEPEQKSEQDLVAERVQHLRNIKILQLQQVNLENKLRTLNSNLKNNRKKLDLLHGEIDEPFA